MKTVSPKIPSPIAWLLVRCAFRRDVLIRLTIVLLGILFPSMGTIVSAQARLILNGGYVNISQNAYLVIDNPAVDAITRNSGYIISEGANNRIKWNIGTTTGTYTIPWGYSGNYIPLTFTKTAGLGSGHYLFSTYHTTWQNSAQLPSGVNNFNGSTGTDNSAFASDRFWQISAESYSANPTLSDLTFTYLESENSASGNTVTESGLVAKRYNSDLNSWTDNIPSSSVNTTNNTVTVASVDLGDTFPWWVLGTLGSNRYWVAPSNSTSNVSDNWSATAGGAGNAGVPTANDVVIFDGTSDANCSLSAALTAASVVVDSNYSGVISQGSNAITLSSTATFSGGTFTGGSSPITVGGSFLLGGTAFTSTSSTLDIKGDFTHTGGTFAHNNGTVSLSGTSGVQNITTAAVMNFNNISVTNNSASPSVRVQTSQNLIGTLTLGTNAVIDADGSNNTSVFKLMSSADNPTADASIATLPSGAQVTGNVTVQRYMALEGPGQKIYRYISSPVQQGTVADLQQEIPVTGTFTGASNCDGCNVTGPTLYFYNESVTTDINGSGANDLNDGYVEFPDAANTEFFAPGRGYTLYVRGNLLSTALWDLRGMINSGNVTPVSFPVTYTSTGVAANDGWNLVGNPFPSTLDWNAASGWTKTNMEGTIYITDNSSAAGAQFASWNGTVGNNGGSRYIAMGQAFWVKASGAPVLQASESVKAAGTQTTFFREESISNLLRITLVKGTVRDETVVHFRNDATAGFDAHADARKLFNATFNLSSALGNGQKLAINSMPSLDCESSIALNLDNVTTGSYRLDFSSFESFPAFTTISLHDKFLGSIHNIQSGASYPFSITSNPASKGVDRFKVTFSIPAPSADFTLRTSDVCEGSSAVVEIDNAQRGMTYLAVRDSLSFPATQQDGQTIITIPWENLHAGANTIRVRGSYAFCHAEIEKEIVVNAKATPVPVAESGKRCGEGTVTLQASGAPETGHYNWYEEATSEAPIEGQNTSSFTTPAITKSRTYYVSTTNEGCESERIPVQATVVILEPATITLSDNLLVSNHPEGNQWYFNGEKIDGATGSSIEPQESGVYSVEVTREGCVASTEYAFVIDGIEQDLRKISLSPNPVRHEALLEIPDSFEDLTEVRIINSLGQLVGTIQMHQTEGRKTGKVKMTDSPPGLYVIQIVSNSAVEEVKFIKE